jgi:hypothetical protein
MLSAQYNTIQYNTILQYHGISYDTKMVYNSAMGCHITVHHDDTQ